MKEMAIIVITIIFVFVFIVGGIFGATFGLAVMSERGYCRDYPKIVPQYEYKWELWSGCMVDVPEYGWVHAIDYFNLKRLGLSENK